VFLSHGGLAPRQQEEAWMKIRNGEFSLVIGARSACLLPLPNIGLAILEEEENSGYKEERKPRFHARDVILKRAELEKFHVILGSSTPSFETYSQVKNGFLSIENNPPPSLPHKGGGITIVDMKEQKRKGLLSAVLKKEVHERLNKREQVVLIVNRKGFFRYVRCHSCGWVARCPTCNVGLVERLDKKLACRYCSYHTDIPKKCPECLSAGRLAGGDGKISIGGAGTERVEDEIKKEFPWVHVVRWDANSTRKKKDFDRIRQEIESDVVDVVVTTQPPRFLFDSPRMTLIGAVNVDTVLHHPDFRSAERAYSALTKLVESGRPVVLQTRSAQHAVLQNIAKLDYENFAHDELKFRDELNYPPFSRLIEIQISGKKKSDIDKQTAALEEGIKKLSDQFPMGVVGPIPVKGAQKWLLKIQPAHFEDSLDVLRAVVSAAPRFFYVDVDPT
jgi:primosomal protein N' (replication factor Y)